ncbi:2Fe-2S iron-sulfur cluster binding domain-containing protein [Bacillus sp. T3]|uniref:2Fe-2S iron-sulfur cluster-binding protein n=1 Tax=Bacillus sp. T3 TaxID=467262 RepID=UPI002982B875|nr:2Fe-2S iron-sulfur cluster binding domain-containing protein [Bacillus sp. T3]
MKRLTIGSLKENYGSIPQIQSAIVVTKQELKKMKRILELEQNQTYYMVEVEKEQSILDAALEKGIRLEYKCKKGTCGRCKVRIINGLTYLQRANHLEQVKLEHLIKHGYRLACQARAK